MVFWISALVTRGADIIGSIVKGIKGPGAGAGIADEALAFAGFEAKKVTWVGAGVLGLEGSIGSAPWVRSGAVMVRVTIGTLELVDLVPCAIVRLTPYICCEVLIIGGGAYTSWAGSVEALSIG
jgi:hypothetical protein